MCWYIVCVFFCRKFNRTIAILQNDIESLEEDKKSLAQKVEQQSKRSVLSDFSLPGRRTLGGKGSPYSSPFSSPYVSRKESAGIGVKGGSGDGGDVVESVTLENTLQTPLLLSRVRYCTCT